MRSAERKLDRLDNLMGRAAAEAHELAARLEQQRQSAHSLAGIARVLRDSAERHRDVVRVLAAIAGTTRLGDAHRLARDYLRSVA